MAYPVLMVALVPLAQWSQAGLLPAVVPGQPFWAQDYQVAILEASGQAIAAPPGTLAPAPEPPFTASMTPGFGTGASNCSPSPPARQAFAVTAAETLNPSNTGVLLRVKVLTGAAASPAGGSGVAAPAASVAMTTTVPGSIVYGAVVDNTEHAGFAWLGSTAGIDDIGDPGFNASYGTFRSAGVTGTPGLVTVGTNTSGSTRALAAMEVVPAPGVALAEVALGPAPAFVNNVSSVATAAFLPPLYSLLVAMVSAEGNGATQIGMALSGGGLTWVQQVAENPAASGYVGVWTAFVSS